MADYGHGQLYTDFAVLLCHYISRAFMDFNCLKILGIIVPFGGCVWLLSTRWQFFWGGAWAWLVLAVGFCLAEFFPHCHKGFISIYERAICL